MKRLILLLCLIALPAWADYVVIISIDGCRPEFYLPGELSKNCETVTGLRDAGSYAKGAMPAYPSMTYPGHTTIATGVTPSKHGVTANNLFDPPKPDGRGFWFARDVKVPALWDVAHKAGLTVGTVSWPCTAESKSIDWIVPEFWTTGMGNELDLMRRHATPGLLADIDTVTRGDGAAWDSYLTKLGAQIIAEHKPNLLLLHLIQTDKAQHHGGRAAADLPAALRNVDANVREIIAATKKAGIFERTTFIVLGDHGFADISKTIAPNWLLAQEGFIKDKSWRALVMNTGGSAAVYLKDPKDVVTAKEVRALLEKNAAGLYRVIDKDALTKLGGPSDAAFYLEAEPGYMFSGAHTGKTLVRSSTMKGNHGYLPTNPQMYTGFVASGRGIKKGVALDVIRLADVAPTVARLLGLKMDGAEGRVLEEILASGG